MNLYNRLIRSGRRLKRLKKAFPYLFAAATLAALLATTPFSIAGNSIALDVLSLLFAAAGIAVKWMAGNKVSGSLEDRMAARGIYSLVRFPDHLAGLLVVAGLAIYTGILWYAVFVIVTGWFVTERIILAEESTLIDKHADLYEAWARQTPALLPNLFAWQKPPRPYRFLNLYHKQSRYTLMTIGGFILIDLLKNRIIEFRLHIDCYLLVLLAAACIPLLLRSSGNRT